MKDEIAPVRIILRHNNRRTNMGPKKIAEFTHHICVRISPAQKSDVIKIAGNKGITLAELCRRALSEFISEYQRRSSETAGKMSQATGSW